MSVVDLILLIIILLSMYSGWKKGFILAVIDLFAWVGTLLLTFVLYAYPAAFLTKLWPSLGVWIMPLAFLFTILLVKVLIDIIIRNILLRVPEEAHSNSLNQVLGIFPGLINGFIYAMLLSAFLIFVPFFKGSANGSRITPLLTSNLNWLENKISPLWDKSLAPTLTNLAVEPGSEKLIKLNFSVTDAKPIPELEQEMLKLINQERKRQGLVLLVFDYELLPVARAHSQDMFRRGYFSHYTPDGTSPFDRIKKARVPFLLAGENLALAQTLDIAHKGLMNSPGHRANILNPSFGRVGIGILDGGFYGLMITQNFRN